MVIVSDDDRYDDDHVGEKPVGWPRESIENLRDAWGAEEIAEDITDCHGCSEEYGVCYHHRGMMEGYDKAVADMSRVFDLTEEDLPDE